MLAPTLDRNFVFTQFELLSSYLKGLNHRSGDRSQRAMELGELAALVRNVDDVGALEQTIARDQPASVHQPPSAFFVQDPLISNMQSAMEMAWSGETYRHVRPSDPDLRFVTDSTLPWFDATRSDKQRLFNAFSVTDVGWLSCKVAEGMAAFKSKHPFVEAFARTELSEDKFRIVLVGDWGTGLPRARRVARSIRAVLEDGLKAGITSTLSTWETSTILAGNSNIKNGFYLTGL